MRIILSFQFEKDFKHLAKKYPSLGNDLRALHASLLENPTQGTSLGDDCYKVRLRIKSKQTGKSGGARVITCILKLEEELILVTMYDKSEVESISDAFLKDLIDVIKKRN